MLIRITLITNKTGAECFLCTVTHQTAEAAVPGSNGPGVTRYHYENPEATFLVCTNVTFSV